MTRNQRLGPLDPLFDEDTQYGAISVGNTPGSGSQTVPDISTTTPAFGTISGGTSVTIIGAGFTDVTSVTIGGSSVSFSIITDGQITATTSAHTFGLVDIAVIKLGIGSDTAVNAFRFAPASFTETFSGALSQFDSTLNVNIVSGELNGTGGSLQAVTKILLPSATGFYGEMGIVATKPQHNYQFYPEPTTAQFWLAQLQSMVTSHLASNTTGPNSAGASNAAPFTYRIEVAPAGANTAIRYYADGVLKNTLSSTGAFDIASLMTANAYWDSGPGTGPLITSMSAGPL